MAKKPDIRNIAHLAGNSGKKMLFAADTKSRPGRIILHLVQIHSVEVPDDKTFDEMGFPMLHADNDERLAMLGFCMNPPEKH